MKNKSNLLWVLVLAGALLPKSLTRHFENKIPLELTDTLNIYTTNPPFVYFNKELNKFDSWIDSTLNESVKNNSNAIIVNKTDYKLYLIKKGKVDSEYNIDLGKNPIDDKQVEGDFCTPEGMYTVEQKVNSTHTKFYKALLINYPNDQDKERGKTGSSIEIHGPGGIGRNWTNGCVALSIKDINEIYPHIKKGDRITIVKNNSKDLSKLISSE